MGFVRGLEIEGLSAGSHILALLRVGGRPSDPKQRKRGCFGAGRDMRLFKRRCNGSSVLIKPTNIELCNLKERYCVLRVSWTRYSRKTDALPPLG